MVMDEYSVGQGMNINNYSTDIYTNTFRLNILAVKQGTE